MFEILLTSLHKIKIIKRCAAEYFTEILRKTGNMSTLLKSDKVGSMYYTIISYGHKCPRLSFSVIAA